MSPVTALNENHEMTREEIIQRLETIAKLPYLIIPQNVYGDATLDRIVSEYNKLRMANRPEDLERMKYLVNVFEYEKEFAKERLVQTVLSDNQVFFRDDEIQQAIDSLSQDKVLEQYYETDLREVSKIAEVDQKMLQIDSFIKELGLESYFKEDEEEATYKR